MSPRIEGAAVAGIIVIILAASFLLDAAPSIGPGYGLCLFRNITHLPCPSCGMTRAFINLSHGGLYDAVHLNPSSIFIYIAAWLGLFAGICQIIFNKPFIRTAWADSKKILFPLVIVMMSASWIYNLIHHFS